MQAHQTGILTIYRTFAQSYGEANGQCGWIFCVLFISKEGNSVPDIRGNIGEVFS